MKTMRGINLPRFLLVPILLIFGLPAALYIQRPAASKSGQSEPTSEARLRRLEDREEIRQLLVNYGLFLDRRDFAGFSQLFTADAEYTGGGEMGLIKGASAIARSLEEVFRKNPAGVRDPNFHLFANEIIQVKSDEATAISKGIFVIPGNDGRPQMVMLATYFDTLARESGRWKFKKRVVHGDIPAFNSRQ